MIRYYFIFGNTPNLSRAELQHLFNYFNLIPAKTYQLADRILIAEFPEKIDSEKLMRYLGGTIKIGEVVAELKKLGPDQLAKVIAAQTTKDWGLSVYSDTAVNLLDLASEIKQELIQPRRYVIPKKGENEISAVVLKKQKLTEFVLIFDRSEKSWLVGVTQSFQDVDEWTKHDRGRPFADSKSGMLPVKISRMLVNLALPGAETEQKTLLDPFCGMGTILAEALLTGWKVIGSDISGDVTEKAKNNIEWLSSIYRYLDISNRSWQISVSDATHVSEKISLNSINAIVTEPFLGTPFETIHGKLTYRGNAVTIKNIQNTIKGLKKLYLGCFKEWRKVLKPGAKVVIIFPEIVWQGKSFSVKKLIDNCEMLGYTLEQGPFEYARPQAIVKRKIYVFKKLT